MVNSGSRRRSAQGLPHLQDQTFVLLYPTTASCQSRRFR